MCRYVRGIYSRQVKMNNPLNIPVKSFFTCSVLRLKINAYVWLYNDECC